MLLVGIPPMQIALLHLSDIHIKSSSDAILGRAKAIKDAFHASAPHAAICIVIVSGDVAFSGTAEQYASALAFFEEIRNHLLKLPSVKTVEFGVVPGNHDCDFQNESDIRRFLLRDIKALYESDIVPTDDRVKVLLDVQKHFFVFESQLTKSKELGPNDRLSWARLVNFENYGIALQCFNTAWLSRKEEIQAKLFFPADSITMPTLQPSICISIFHHPYNWLDSGNYRALKDLVEQSSDFVFTGHEHVAGGGAVQRFSGEHLHYVDGAALQGEGGLLDSGFNFLLINTESGEQRLDQFRWNGDFYSSKQQTEWVSLINNPTRKKHVFRIARRFAEWLDSMDIRFSHRRKPELLLPDVFVYPDCRYWSIDLVVKGGKDIKNLYSKDVVQHFRDNPRILVTGTDYSGKTALLKRLYTDLGGDFVPLLLKGSNIEGKISEHRLEKLIKDAVAEQYDDSSVERFMQLDPNRRILLIDDFHRASLTRGNERKFIEFVTNRFGHVVIAAADYYGLRELSTQDPLLGFESCAIKPFGHQLRGRLIHKWLALERDSASEIAALDYEVRSVEKVITTLLGDKVVPPVPFNILSLLQVMESTQPHATTDGSYGALCELLIRAALANSTGGLADADLKVSYISSIAYSMFSNKRHLLSEADLRRTNEDFQHRFHFGPEFPAILNELVLAKVLERQDAGYRFKYKHYYYYFLAKYFERAVKRTDAIEVAHHRNELEYMAERLHNEEFANTVLFYAYLTQDWQLISYLIKLADNVYSERAVATLETEVAFVNRIYKEPPKMLIADLDVEEHQDEFRRKQDEVEEQNAAVTIALDQEATYSADLNDIHKLNIAFKTLQVLGQVLRSSVDTLEGDQKQQIVSACYRLGLRALGMVLVICENNLEPIRLYLAMLIKQRCAVMEKEMTKDELLRHTDEGVIWITHQYTYGTIRGVAYAVGHQHLEETYDRVLSEHPGNAAVEMIDLAIKLEHFRTVPEYEITKLRDRVSGNHFSYALLLQLVTDFLYLHRVDVRTMQRLGSLFKIEGVMSPRYLLLEHKL